MHAPKFAHEGSGIVNGYACPGLPRKRNRLDLVMA